MKCLAQSVRRNEESDNAIDFTPEVDINLNETHYFKDEIAVKINCDFEESDSSKE